MKWTHVLFFISIGLVGCDWQTSTQPSILVIAVEGLDSESLSCAELAPELEPTAFDNFCREAVRFSHAYTTSTMSQASLASVLTGKYPLEHGVRHNGSHYLSESWVTNAEVAHKKGYRTAMFSGGAPIWRKSGLDQGFEFFEDHITISFHSFYQNVGETFSSFTKWLSDESEGAPFFTFIYLPDLQYEYLSTQNKFGEERALERNSQLEEINESFESLVHELKRKKRWDNTHVLLTGINGRTERYRDEELSALNLHGENTQVALLWKPARRNNEAGAEWAIDANVTLADVGKTLFQILGDSQSDENPHEVVSLREVLSGPRVTWNKDRMILTESAWADWRRESGVRYAFRQKYVLYIHDREPKIYNSLVDRFEVQPISAADPSVADIVFEAKKFFKEQKIEAWKPLPESLIEKVRFARDWMAKRSRGDENLDARIGVLYRKRPWDSQVRGWLFFRSLETRDWILAEKIAKDSAEPALQYFASKKLGRDVPYPLEGCLSLLRSKSKNGKKRGDCRDAEFLSLIKYVNAPEEERDSAQADFFKLFFRFELNELISRYNYQSGLRWDTDLNIPAEPRLSRLILETEPFRSVRGTVERELKRRSSSQR